MHSRGLQMETRQPSYTAVRPRREVKVSNGYQWGSKSISASIQRTVDLSSIAHLGQSSDTQAGVEACRLHRGQSWTKLAHQYPRRLPSIALSSTVILIWSPWIVPFTLLSTHSSSPFSPSHTNLTKWRMLWTSTRLLPVELRIRLQRERLREARKVLRGSRLKRSVPVTLPQHLKHTRQGIGLIMSRGTVECCSAVGMGYRCRQLCHLQESHHGSL